jgi:hypothetical protein
VFVVWCLVKHKENFTFTFSSVLNIFIKRAAKVDIENNIHLEC